MLVVAVLQAGGTRPGAATVRLRPPTVAAGLNFTLATDLGALDLLGEMQPTS